MRHGSMAFAAHRLALAAAATLMRPATARPYIGYVYPAGGQQGTTFQVRLGGQNMDRRSTVFVSGRGVQADVLSNTSDAEYPGISTSPASSLQELRQQTKPGTLPDPAGLQPAVGNLPHAYKIRGRWAICPTTKWRRGSERRSPWHVLSQPAIRSASLVLVEVTMDADAEPGPRGLRAR